MNLTDTKFVEADRPEKEGEGLLSHLPAQARSYHLGVSVLSLLINYLFVSPYFSF